MTGPNPSAPVTLAPSAPAVLATPDARATPNLHLSGVWPVLARAVCGKPAMLISTLFLANLPFYFAHPYLVCLHLRRAPRQLTPASARALDHLHLDNRETNQ
jgi:hypothetical protein